MGVAVSTHVTTYPLSLASGIIGFVSFAFTLGTFLKVVWVNLETLSESAHEVHGFLTTLRTELLEEKANLKAMRKSVRKYKRSSHSVNVVVGIELDEFSIKTMTDLLRQYIKQFRDLERPFLAPGEHGIGDLASHHHRPAGARPRRRADDTSLSPPRYSHAAYSSPPEKYERGGGGNGRARSAHDRDRDRDRDEDEETFWAQRIRYAPFTLVRRFKWLYKKPEAQTLTEALTRVQTRRMAKQVAGITVMMHEYGRYSVELHDAVGRIDDRVSRVVGVRRVSE